MGTKMAASFANIFIVKIKTTLIQQSETKLKNQRPVTHLLSQNSPLSKMVDCYKREAWALSTRFLRRKLISTEEAHFYGGSCFLWRKADFYEGSWFLRRRLISTEEAHFYGGSWFLRRRLISTEEADFYWGGSFLRRKLISTQEADFHWGGQFLSNRLIFVWKTRTIAQRKQGFNPERVCFTVCSSGTSGPPYYSSCHPLHTKKAIPFSLALRLRRICSTDATFHTRTAQLATYLLKRGYNRNFVNKQIRRAADIPRQLTLQTKDINKPKRIPFITTFNPSLSHISHIIKKHFNLLLSSNRCKSVFQHPPVVAFRRSPNLRDLLVTAKLPSNSANPQLPCGSFRYGKNCATCPYISHGLTTYSFTFFSTGETRPIKFNLVKLKTSSLWFIATAVIYNT